MTAGHDISRRFSSLVRFACSRTILPILMVSFMSISTALAAIPPKQPSSGPGGADYPYRTVRSSTNGFGDLQYYIFEPDGPKPSTAPLIVFVHGFGGTNPMSYGAWINHIVKKGNIVVYPKYQSMMSMVGGSLRYTSNCIKSVQDALSVLQGPGHVKPDMDKFATVGHSYGGILTVNVAALAQQSGLPTPKAVMSVQPGVSTVMPLEDLSLIPADALLLTVVGDRDVIVGNRDAKKIFRRTSQIPFENKDYVVMVSDNHGLPGLSADHFAPTCMAPVGGMMSGLSSLIPSFGNLGPDFAGLLPDLNGYIPEFGGLLGEYFDNLISNYGGSKTPDDSTPDPGTDLGNMPDLEFLLPTLTSTGTDIGSSLIPMFGANAFDFYCTWKLFDALTDAAFYGKNREWALGNTPQQRYMGEWSDGKPVKELVITDTP